MKVLKIISQKANQFMGEPKMEGVNNTEIMEDKIDYKYGNLSKIDTNKLKQAYIAYKNFHGDDHGKEVLFRIEGELLSRKELTIDESLFSKN